MVRHEGWVLSQSEGKGKGKGKGSGWSALQKRKEIRGTRVSNLDLDLSCVCQRVG